MLWQMGGGEGVRLAPGRPGQARGGPSRGRDTALSAYCTQGWGQPGWGGRHGSNRPSTPDIPNPNLPYLAKVNEKDTLLAIFLLEAIFHVW